MNPPVGVVLLILGSCLVVYIGYFVGVARTNLSIKDSIKQRLMECWQEYGGATDNYDKVRLRTVSVTLVNLLGELYGPKTFDAVLVEDEQFAEAYRSYQEK